MDNNIQIVDISDVDELYLIEKKTYKSPWNKRHFESDIKNKFSLNYSYKKNFCCCIFSTQSLGPHS